MAEQSYSTAFQQNLKPLTFMPASVRQPPDSCAWHLQ
jgi:hypothetical protein